MASLEQGALDTTKTFHWNKPLYQKGSIMIVKRRTQLLASMVVLALASPVQVAFGHDWDHDHWGHHDHDFPPFGHDHGFHHHDHAGAAVAAGILGLAIAAAIADNGNNRPHDVYAPPPQPYYAPPPYRLSNGITCYPAQRACYLANGHYAGLTTHSQFGN
ncbi:MULTISPECIES: hypothetical protein [Brucella/Ochrobactrum group]|uniref:Uncharacterized protein n=2 Tax=Ochrobactrum TaxID=528 RepID=A0A2P9HI62_9HYPH|nr:MULTISPECIES: hypothetical protein [Brucella]MCI0999034.1 hypothetical protein [Ochrobactrum sp. C6C9]RRD21891.1 hypothetical protein ECB98_22590 [Brucellaceae bacterium VT-16-1752]MDX4076436.1 hypothetical protein [Brucella sp. NBRC 113783]NNU62647.1 hypothetical protein [[Ochrobactrum] soli]RLL73285.1 hypothetical protein D8666_15990 [[Ochrobactrum] soli]